MQLWKLGEAKGEAKGVRRVVRVWRKGESDILLAGLLNRVYRGPAPCGTQTLQKQHRSQNEGQSCCINFAMYGSDTSPIGRPSVCTKHAQQKHTL